MVKTGQHVGCGLTR